MQALSSQSENLQTAEEEIMRLRGELETRLKNVTCQEHAMKRFEGLQEQHSQLKTDLKSTQRQLEVFEKSHQKFHSENDDLQKQLRRLEESSETGIQRLQGEIRSNEEHIEKQVARIKQLQSEKRYLTDSLDKKEESAKSFTDMQDRNHDLEKEVKVKESRIQQMANDLQQMNEQLWEQKIQSDNLEDIARTKEKHIHDLTLRLSAEMETKFSADECIFENVNTVTWSMKIASEYELLYTNQWLTAKMELDVLLPDTDKENEEAKMKSLCHILEIGLGESYKLQKRMLNAVGKMLQMPGKADTDAHNRDLPETVMQNLKDSQRQTVKATDLSVLCQNIQNEVTNKANTTFTNPKVVMSCQDPLMYIEAVAVITWKMVLQQPQMSLRQDGIGDKWQGDTKQNLFWTASSDPEDPASRVKYYIYPALYHKESMQVKGQVILSKD